jgi:hypothetical protein
VIYKSADFIFNKLKKKYDNNFIISYYDFYEKILNNFEYKKSSIFFLFKNLFLALLSLISLIRIILFKNISSANYFIINNTSSDYIDSRSKYYLSKKKIFRSINLVRSENFFESIVVYLKFNNIIFINSFKYIIGFFIGINKLNNSFLKIHKNNYLFYLLIKKIFLFLKIKKFYSIDDYRIMPIFLKIADELNINSIGYMHGRISKHNISHRYFSFKKIYVVSNFFKEQLLELNPQYHKNNIIINRNIKYKKKFLKNIKNNKNYKIFNILFIIDKNIGCEKKIIKYFDQILACKGINLFIKFRPNDNPNLSLINYCMSKNIIFFHRENVYEIFIKNNINYLISSSSTLLLESSLFKIFPLMLITEDDYANDFLSKKVVFPIHSFKNFLKKIKNLSQKSKELNQIYKTVWLQNNL